MGILLNRIKGRPMLTLGIDADVEDEANEACTSRNQAETDSTALHKSDKGLWLFPVKAADDLTT